jgi:hypothetical protein
MRVGRAKRIKDGTHNKKPAVAGFLLSLFNAGYQAAVNQ